MVVSTEAITTVNAATDWGDTMLRIRFDEILPARIAARELPQALDRLERGDVEHLVVTRRNHPRAVLLTVDRYEELLMAREPQSHAA